MLRPQFVDLTYVPYASVAIAVPADELFGCSVPRKGFIWAYWFGDDRISQVNKNNIHHFKDFFRTFGLDKKSHKKLQRGIIEAVKEYAFSLGYDNTDDWSDDMCQKWMVEENTLSPNGEKRTAISEKLRMQLNRVGKVIAEAEDSDSNEEFSDEQEDLRKRIKRRSLALDDICMSCFSKNPVQEHPVFEGRLCYKCLSNYKTKVFASGADQISFYCAICSRSGNVFVCDVADCGSVYCRDCVDTFCAPRAVFKIKKATPWNCFMCRTYNKTIDGLLRIRNNWNENLYNLFNPKTISTNPILPKLRQPIRVVSLFDGLGTARLVLQRLNIKVEAYYSFEIDKDAVNVVRSHFSDVILKGDVVKFTRDTLDEVGRIDLLIGGSPCEELSLVNPARKGIYDPSGTGILFFEFYRILKLIQEKNENVFWLFENVVSMQEKTRDIINRFFENEPVLYDAKWFTAQKRRRYFWGNIPGLYTNSRVAQESGPHLQDYMSPNMKRKALVNKVRTITTNANSLTQGKCKKTVETEKGEENLWITEIETLFGYDSHYTDVGNISLSKRQKLLGKAWSVPVVCNILKPLSNYFTRFEPKEECLNDDPVKKIRGDENLLNTVD